MATYGRRDSIEVFIEKLLDQDYDLLLVQLIIVDQNDKISIDDLIDKYNEKLKIIHIKSKKRGLSYNRNLGINYADGQIIAFPDDDCYYYKDTLKIINSLFENTEIDCYLGRIYDFDRECNVIREWRKEAYEIKWWNFYRSLSSITMFYRSDLKLLFDEKFGVGAKFGSCEDADFIVHILKEKKKIVYNPSIVVWHPIESVNDLTVDKIKRYGYGFGAFCRKNLNIYIIVLFFAVISFHLLDLFKHTIGFDFAYAKKKIIYLKSRMYGFYKFD